MWDERVMDTGSGHCEARRFWERVRLGALLPYAAMGALLVVVIVIVGWNIDHHIDAIEAWLKAISPWGVVAFIALFVVLTSFFVPGSVMAVIGGALFGLGCGTLAVVVGALASATVQYFLARHLLRDRIERRLSAKPSLLAIPLSVQRVQFRLQVLLRLSPLSPVLCNYMLGAGAVRFPGFFVAGLAMIPGLFMQVYFGRAGKHLADWAGRRDRSIETHDVVLLGGLLFYIIVMFLVARSARKELREAMAEDARSASSEPSG
jgi:uncharacterized membrane protein YdjX (TVP38/TMEM64 family)